MSNEKKTAGTKGEDITNGIDILPWTIKSEDGTEVTYSTWDFAGQTLYYNTHQVNFNEEINCSLCESTS